MNFKKRKNYFTLFLIILFIYSFLPYFIFAEEVPSLKDPLGNRDIPVLVGDIINYILGILGVLALVMFIYGGFMWMTSGGSSEKIQKGKSTIVWAVLGLAFIFFSYALLNFILEALLKSQ